MTDAYLKDTISELRAELAANEQARKELATVAQRGLDEITALKAEVERLRDALGVAFCIADNAPELNPSNYDHEDCCELNAAMVELHGMLMQSLKDKEVGGE